MSTEITAALFSEREKSRIHALAEREKVRSSALAERDKVRIQAMSEALGVIHTIQCPRCEGRGFETVEVPMPQSNSRDVGEIYEDDRPCEECAGIGVAEDEKEEEPMTARDMDKILDEAFKKVFGDRW
jgi:DnaJ-class molecular chaperone